MDKDIKCVYSLALFTGRKQLLDWYSELQLREYRGIFRTNDEVHLIYTQQ
jgi:hypothetical protein